MLHSMLKMINIRAFLQPPNNSLYERADEKTTCVPATLEKMQMFEYFLEDLLKHSMEVI